MNFFYIHTLFWLIVILLVVKNKEVDKKYKPIKAPISGVYEINGELKTFEAGDQLK